MSKPTSASIARKAQAKAEADFATWLMMAKLGSFDELPPNARSWLTSYRTQLEQMSESDATSATIREIYIAYYVDMGGAGQAPAPARNATRAEDKIVDLKEARLAKVSRTTDRSAPARSRLPLPPLLIFAGMVAALAALKFAFGF